jgi:hypothetical protein
MRAYLIRPIAVALAFAISACACPVETTRSISDTLPISNLIQWSDNSAVSQSVDTDGNGFLDVGDTLRGTFQIETREDLTPPNDPTVVYGSSGVNELSGIFEIAVINKTFISDGQDNILGTGDDRFDYAFGIHAPFQTEFGLSGATMAVFFEDPTPDYERTGSIVAAEATATDGTKVVEIGFSGDADESWVSLNTPQDPSLGAFVPQATGLGTFNFSLGFLFNSLFSNSAKVSASCFPICFGDGLVDINASAGFSGTSGSSTDYDMFDNVDLVFQPVPV